MILVDELAGEREIEAGDRRDDWLRRCDRAAQLMEAQPDVAALLLDGLLSRIARDWERRLRLAAGSPEELLARIEHAAPLLGWRLRLALRAPDARARLVACQALIEAMDE